MSDPAEKPAWLIQHEAFLAAGREATDYYIAWGLKEEKIRLVRPDENDDAEERIASEILRGRP